MPAAPSLLIVPYRSKTGRLYSQIPVPVAPATTGAGDFTVTRNTTATRLNSAGAIDSVASGIPRLDYLTSGGTAGCPALLVEPAATNLCFQSAGFQVSGTWVPTNIAVTTGTTSAFTAPDNSTDADLLADDTTNGRHRVQQNLLSFTSGTTYTFSIFVKKNSSGRFLLINANTAFNSIAVLSLDTLAITNISGSGASVENYGNGWYRFSIRGTASATTAGGTVFVQMQDTNADGTYIGNGSSFYLWGAQLETGSVATSYIPTTTGTGSRSADVISVSGAVSGSIGQTEGTIYAEFVNTLVASYAEGYMYRVFADANNEIWARKEGGGNTYSFRWRANSQNTTFLNVAVPNGVSKIAFGYKSGDTALFLNGSQVATTNTDVRAFSVNPTTIALGSTSSGQFFNDRIRAVALYTTRLTDAELATLTA